MQLFDPIWLNSFQSILIHQLKPKFQPVINNFSDVSTGADFEMGLKLGKSRWERALPSVIEIENRIWDVVQGERIGKESVRDL